VRAKFISKKEALFYTPNVYEFPSIFHDYVGVRVGYFYQMFVLSLVTFLHAEPKLIRIWRENLCLPLKEGLHQGTKKKEIPPQTISLSHFCEMTDLLNLPLPFSINLSEQVWAKKKGNDTGFCI